MFKKYSFAYLLIILLIISTGACVSKPLQERGQIITSSAADWAQLRLAGGYVIINNVWNKGATSGAYQQKIFQETIQDKTGFGWQWNWSTSSNVVAYPEVVYGDKPWDQPLGLVAQFPVQAGRKKITAHFDIRLDASGVYNMAFSLWAVSVLPATKDTITHEIMIWNVNQFMTPAGIKKDTLDVDGNRFDLFIRANHVDASGVNSNNWTYIAFCAQKPMLKGPLQISAFIDYLLGKGILKNDNYLTSVELGNEIVQGAGIAEISDYAITLE